MIIKKYIYDLTTRILHAVIGILVLVLFLTGKLAKNFYEYNDFRLLMWKLHILFGYGLSLAFIYRLIWFFVGNEYAKLNNFIQLKELIRVISKLEKPIWNFGHHPFAGLGYLFFYILIALITFSGMFLSRIEHDQGPISAKFFDDMLLYARFIELHEIVSSLILAFFLLHIVALFKHQKSDGVPIFTSMKDGYQYKRLNKE